VVSDVELPGLQPPTGRARRSQRAQEKRRKKRKRRSFVAVLVSLSILVLAGGAVWFGAKPIIASLTAPSDFPGPGTGSVMVKIEAGASGRAIGQLLAEKKVVKSAKAFVDAANKDPRAQKIRPGTYELRLQMTSSGAIALLSDPKNRQVKTFTVAEGKRVAEIVDIIAKTGIAKKDLQAALKDPAALGIPEWATSKKGLKFPAEGFLFPKTYEVEPGDTAVSVLSAMVTETLDELTAAGVPSGQEWKVLTEASILQAEGGKSSDYPKMARALDNRTKKGWKFQLDSTTSYAVQRFGVTTTQKERDTPSPYNTYYVKGLPLGPICNPGADAIAAALAPAKGTWLYWVTVNPETGETKFATTDAEAQRNKAEFQKWLRDHPQGT
jgi:UPF0755 protein